MKTTKKQKKSNLKVSLLLLLLAAVLLISSTYAWFIANNTATISTINVKVETVEGIQISVDADNWKDTISNADITGAGATYDKAINQLPGILKPVSSGASSANVTESKLDMFNVTAVDSGETSGDNVGRKKWYQLRQLIRTEQREIILHLMCSSICNQRRQRIYILRLIQT